MSSTQEPVDLLLTGAPVYRDGAWHGDCLAVLDGTIVWIGSQHEAPRFVGPETRVENTSGGWVLPAFHDAHVHPVQAGLEMNQCDLTDCATAHACLEQIRHYAASHPQAEWITGGGWSMDSFPGGVPTAAQLDQVVPDRPVYLPNRDHHSAWVNSLALARASVDAGTADPHDGRIERDATGRPSGALHEGAMRLVGALVTPPGNEDLVEALLTAQRHLHSLGIVGWQDALVGQGLGMQDTLGTYAMAHERGLLTSRVVLALWWDRDRGLEQIPELVERRTWARARGLDAGTVKIMLDGVCETHTASMRLPYLDRNGRPTGNVGLSFLSADDLRDSVTALDALDFQVHIHAIGDQAVRDSLDAIEAARRVNGPRGNRHHLAHVQVVDSDDVSRFAQLEVAVNGQPLWACREEAMEVLTLPFLPEQARAQQYVFGSMVRAGTALAFGSDWPVSSANPLWGMHVAVNRRAPNDATGAAALLPEEAISVEEALAAYTLGSAFVNRLEESTGSLREGMSADLVMVDRDLLTCPPDQIATATVLLTVSQGRVVFRAD